MNPASPEQPANTDLMSTEQKRVEQALRGHLDAEVDNLDYNVVNKLAAARRRAMTQSGASLSSGARSRTLWVNWPTLVGSTAVIALALLLGSKLYSPATVSSGPDQMQAGQGDLMEDLQLLSASDDIEFYQSMEFLEWMESNS